MTSLLDGSLFGQSGFYMGAGTGANFTTSTLKGIGYKEGINVEVPIGWSRTDFPIGVRGEVGVQSFRGRFVPSYTNQDPVLYTGTLMATLNLPLNDAGTTFFYVMGGGGAYNFHHFGVASTLNEKLAATSTSETRFGVTGGAGLEIRVLGATSLFVESNYTNVFVDKNKLSTDVARTLRWVPIVAGVTLR